MPTARPSKFTQKLADRICDRVAGGESLHAICKDPKMPAERSVYRWLNNEKYAAFGLNYARAREIRADKLAEEILEIADDGSKDWTVDKDGREIVDHEHIQRSKLRVDARKWAAAKLAPKKYSDRMEVSGPGGGPIAFTGIECVIVDPKPEDGGESQA